MNRQKLRRHYEVYLEPRDAWWGAYRGRGNTYYWCPVPFVVVRIHGDPRNLGAMLVILGLLSQVVGPGWPGSLLLIGWLAWPGAVLLWWSRRHYARSWMNGDGSAR